MNQTMTNAIQATASEYPVDNIWVYDIEVAANFFLIGFLSPDNDDHITFIDNGLTGERFDRNALLDFISGKTIAGYNSIGYDSHVLVAALEDDTSQAQLLDLSQKLIHGKKHYRHATIQGVDQTDLQPLVSKKTSLKMAGIKLGYPVLELLPFEPNQKLSAETIAETIEYNLHDLKITKKIAERCSDELAMRKLVSDEYGFDARSVGDAALGEKAMVNRYCQMTNIDPHALAKMPNRIPMGFRVDPPSWTDQVENPDITNLIDKIFDFEYQPNVHSEKGITGVSSKIRPTVFDEPVVIGGMGYKLAFGGLHSIEAAGTWKPAFGEHLINLDFSSFYPNIMLTQKIKPSHMTSVYLIALRELLDRRLAAKAKGDKIANGALKIIINSIYGKLNSSFSALFDYSALHRVVLIGQMTLITMADDLVARGHQVISGNTDGITVLTKNLEDLRERYKHWEKVFEIAIDEEEFGSIVLKDINNYTAIGLDGGIYKAKGSYKAQSSLTTALAAPVVVQAVHAYLADGIPVEHTIRNATSPHNFMYSSSSNHGHFLNGVSLGNKVRAYASIDGGQIETQEGNKIGKLPSKVTLAAVLPNKVPSNIDWAHYVNSAKDLCQPRRIVKSLDYQRRAKAFSQETGLTVSPRWAGVGTPKGFKASGVPGASAVNDWTSYDSYGIRTGFDVGTIAIDIDDVTKMSAAIREAIEPTLVVQAAHEGEHDFDAVLAGKVRGKLIYKLSDKFWPLKTTAKKADKTGVEVFYDASVAASGQRLKDQKIYKTSGVVTELPQSLYDAVKAECFTPASFRAAGTRVAPGEVTDADADYVRFIYENYPPLSGIDPEQFKPGAFRSYCFHEHSKPKPDQLMIASVNGKAFAHCFHATCSARSEFAEAEEGLRSAFRASQGSATVTAVAAEATARINAEMLAGRINIHETVAAAMQAAADEICLIVPTGGGKSFESARESVEVLSRGGKVIFIGSVKTDTRQWIKTLEGMLGTSFSEAGGIRLYRDSAKGSDSDEDIGVSAVWPVEYDENWRVIGTHHTYLNRKGDSSEFYPIWRLLEDRNPGEELLLIVDEFDALIEKATRHIDLDQRRFTTRVKGDPTPEIRRLKSCPAYSRGSRQDPMGEDSPCNKCTLHENTLRWKVNTSSIFEFFQPTPYDSRSEKEFSLPIITTSESKNWNTFEMATVENHPAALEAVDFGKPPAQGEEFVHPVEEYLTQLIDTAWRPRMIQRHPYESSEGLWNYPPTPCQVRSLLLLDKSPFEALGRYAKNALRLRTMTGTLDITKREFLAEAMPNMVMSEIEVDERKIARSAVILIDGTCSKNQMIELAKKQPTFLVAAKKADLAEMSIPVEGYNLATYSEGGYISNTSQIAQKVDIQLTYARSSISRGIDLPQFKSVIMTGQPYKPSASVLSGSLDNLGDAVDLDYQTTTNQNAGRVLRLEPGEVDARRLFVVTSPMVRDREVVKPQFLIDNIQSRTEQPVEYLVVKGFGQASRAMDQWISEGQLPEPEVLEDEILIENLSHNQRLARADEIKAAKEERAQIKRAHKRTEIMDRAMAGEFQTYKLFYTATNARRYFEREELIDLRRLFE
ncbi:hypothetical protein N9H70_08330 [Pseudomonadales bacterium]|nr:hypothetical protein [Pseudomonadales bacterium]